MVPPVYRIVCVHPLARPPVPIIHPSPGLTPTPCTRVTGTDLSGLGGESRLLGTLYQKMHGESRLLGTLYNEHWDMLHA